MFTKQAPAEDSRSVTMASMKPPQLVSDWIIIAERFHAFHLRSSRPIYQVRSDNGPDETSALIKFYGGTTQDKPLETSRPYEMKLLFY